MFSWIFRGLFGQQSEECAGQKYFGVTGIAYYPSNNLAVLTLEGNKKVLLENVYDMVFLLGDVTKQDKLIMVNAGGTINIYAEYIDPYGGVYTRKFYVTCSNNRLVIRFGEISLVR